MFLAIFTKGDNFCDLLFASVGDIALPNWGLHGKGNNWLGREQSLSFKTDPHRKGGINMAEMLPLMCIHLSQAICVLYILRPFGASAKVDQNLRFGLNIFYFNLLE